MKVIATLARYLVGIMAVVFGLNKFLNFMPAPEGFSETAIAFMMPLAESFVYPTFGIMLLVSGVLFLMNRAVPLALLILAPFVYGIFVFHITLAPEWSLGMVSYIFTALYILVLIPNWNNCFGGLCKNCACSCSKKTCSMK